MTGCNLRCAYCDTIYAYEEGTELAEDEIISKVKEFGIRLVELTGGEPLLQSGARLLTKRLLDEGYDVLIETNGSMSIEDVDNRAVIIMDIKTPKSGMFDMMDLSNLKLLKPLDELKFVLADREDYEWTKEFIMQQGLSGRCRILLAPSFGTLPARALSQWIIQDRLPVRLNLQLHKYIYGPEERGV
ncbi:MAG: radical SAM protein [Nitrospirota bacterium]